MKLQDNPFYILEASMDDDKRTILRKAEEKSLFDDPARVEEAKEILIDGTKRVLAEISWFPYADKKYCKEIKRALENGVVQSYRLATHSLNAYISYMTDIIYEYCPESENFGEHVLLLDRKWAEEIELDGYCEDLLEAINKHRENANMPLIDAGNLIKHIDVYREFVIAELRNIIQTLPSENIIMSMGHLVAKATNDGAQRASVLVEALLAMYELEINKFREMQANKIMVDVKVAGKREQLFRIERLISNIIGSVRLWQKVMRPVQIYYLSKEERHDLSESLLTAVRNLAITLNNDYERPDLSQELLEGIAEIDSYVGLPEFAKTLAIDIKTLDSMVGRYTNPTRAATSDCSTKKINHERQLVEQREYVIKILSRMQGAWFNDNGENVLTITQTTINGHEVEVIYNVAGGSSCAIGTFKLQVPTGGRDIRIAWHIKNFPSDYLIVNDEQMLHKTKEYFYESIGGVHLGMSVDNVIKSINKPTRILTENNPLYDNDDNSYNNGWYYADKGIIITFAGNGVDRIILLGTSRLRFNRSLLNCNNLLSDFAREYSMDKIPQWPNEDYDGVYAIGNGEYLSFGKNMKDIMLTFYNS